MDNSRFKIKKRRLEISGLLLRKGCFLLRLDKSIILEKIRFRIKKSNWFSWRRVCSGWRRVCSGWRSVGFEKSFRLVKIGSG